MDKEDYYALIEKKIDGTLVPEEQIIFDHQMQTDSEFVRAYQLQTAIVRGFKQRHRHTLYEKLEAAYQADKVKQVRRCMLYRYGAVAATVLLIIVAGVYIFFKPTQSEVLYEAYYRPFRVGPLLRSSASTEPLGTQLYKQHQYQAAIPVIQQEINQHSANSDTLRLIMGNSYLQVDSLAKAVEQFNLVTNPSLVEHKQWYLALIYIRQGKYEQAKPLLKKLQLKGYYRQKAKDLLSRLE